MANQRPVIQRLSKSRAMNTLRLVTYAFLGISVSIISYLLAVQFPVTDYFGPFWMLLLIVWFALLFAAAVIFVEHHNTMEEKIALLRAQEHSSLNHDQLQAVLNSMSVGIVGVSKNGTVRIYNAAFLGLLDSNDNLSGRKINDILPLHSSEGDQPIDIMSYIEKGTLIRHDDAMLRYSEDDEIRLGILVNTIHESGNEPAGYIFIIEDITKEKTLEDERDEFISVVSHELRTPITVAEGSISNALLLLERGADTTMLRQTFKESHEQIIFLAGMINDLSTLSRAERGVGDTTEKIVVDDLANELFSKYSPIALEKSLHFNLDLAGRIGHVTTSRLYLEEILQNFITNAIKYTPSGKVTLSIRRVDDGVKFAVVDTGIGISVGDQKKIFDKFYRSEDYRTRETNGTGLGLYVVRKLAKKLSVKIDVTSRLNHGSTFSFILPYSK